MDIYKDTILSELTSAGFELQNPDDYSSQNFIKGELIINISEAWHVDVGWLIRNEKTQIDISMKNFFYVSPTGNGNCTVYTFAREPIYSGHIKDATIHLIKISESFFDETVK